MLYLVNVLYNIVNKVFIVVRI